MKGKIWLLICLMTLLVLPATAMAACSCGDYEYVKNRYTYAQRDSNYHWRTAHVTYRCTTCGDTYEEQGQPDYFAHEFSGNKCTLCGYTKGQTVTCTHEGWKDGEYRDAYVQNSSTQHWKVTYIDWKCLQCGKQYTEEQSRTAQSHTFSGNKCTKCGYIRSGGSTTCDHSDSSYHKSTPFGDIEYTPAAGGTSHTIERHYKITCRVCGKVITSDYVGRTTETHTFNSVGKCTKCGYSRGGASATATPRPTVAPSVSATLTGSGSTRSIYVTSSGRWTATTNDNWLKLNKTSGASGETIQVTLAANPSTTSSRRGYVYITCGTAKKTVMITQPRSSATATPMPVNTSIKVGDVVTFGRYEQDGNSSNGREPIEWLVLEVAGDKVLLLSRYGLDSQPYHVAMEDVTWETCTLRKWLNGTFMINAFTTSETAAIYVTTVTADKNPKYDTDPGKTTRDKIFLLSLVEAEKYFRHNDVQWCQPTAYAIARGADAAATYNSGGIVVCSWWLRSPGIRPSNAASGLWYGTLNYSGTHYDGGPAVAYDYMVVRPAMWVDLNSGILD